MEVPLHPRGKPKFCSGNLPACTLTGGRAGTGRISGRPPKNKSLHLTRGGSAAFGTPMASNHAQMSFLASGG